jgi:sulfur carrier protein ThiS
MTPLTRIKPKVEYGFRGVMRIQVHLMGMLKSKEPVGNELELPDGATIEQALVALDVPAASVQIFTVNGQLIRDRTHSLHDKDNLSILPPVGGG